MHRLYWPTSKTHPSPQSGCPGAYRLEATRRSDENADGTAAYGDELRLHLAQTQSAVNPPSAGSDYDYAPEATYPAYPYNYPDASYPAYPDNYYTYAGWPVVYWPSVYVRRCPALLVWEWRFLSAQQLQPTFGRRGPQWWAGAARPAPQARAGFPLPAVVIKFRSRAISGGSQGFGHSGGRAGGQSR